MATEYERLKENSPMTVKIIDEFGVENFFNYVI